MKPPCANWNVWKGAEVEGVSELGAATLFIRRPSPDLGTVFWQHSKGCKRVWLCKEYLKTRAKDELKADIAALRKYGMTVAVEIMLEDVWKYSYLAPTEAVVYVKIPNADWLRKGDHVCIGPAFSDEAFCIGSGASVTPDAYAKDIQIQ